MGNIYLSLLDCRLKWQVTILYPHYKYLDDLNDFEVEVFGFFLNDKNLIFFFSVTVIV